MARHPIRKRSWVAGLPMDSVQETIVALVNGQADAIVGSISVEFERQRSSNLGVRMAAQIPESRADSVIAVRKDWPELKGILDKALADVSEEELRALEFRWIGDPSRRLWSTTVGLPEIVTAVCPRERLRLLSLGDLCPK
jgi:ABC-type amino acid transport substrate-binding protein